MGGRQREKSRKLYAADQKEARYTETITQTTLNYSPTNGFARAARKVKIFNNLEIAEDNFGRKILFVSYK